MPRGRRRRRTQYTDSMSGVMHGMLALVLLGGAGIIVWYMVGEAQKPKADPVAKKKKAPRPRGKTPLELFGGGSPRNNSGKKGTTSTPVPQGPNIHEIVNDLNVALLSREAARYRRDRSAEKRYDGLADDARRRLESAVKRGATEVPTHLEPLDNILAVDDSALKKIPPENASEVLDRTLKKVGRDQFVKFKVDRYGTEKDLYVYFPMVAKPGRVVAAGSNRITITKEFARQVQEEVLSQPVGLLSMKERKKIDGILSRGEATEEEYAYLSRRVALRSASTAREERTQFDRQLARLEPALKSAPIPDAIVKLDGSRVKGKIVGSDKAGVTIDTHLGTTVTIPRAQVRYERTAEQLRQEFMGRVQGAKDYSDALPKLLVWTREWEMPTHREYVAFMMLRRNPHDRVARLAAGYDQSPDGSWVLAERRPTAERPQTKTALKPELENMGFLFRGGKWYSQADWSVGIDNLHSRPDYPLAMRGVKIWQWHLDDTPQSREIDASGKKGKRTYSTAPRLRFLAPSGASGTASITIQAPAEIVSCKVKAPGEIVARGAAGAKIDVFVTAAGGRSTPIYSLEQGRNESFYDISYQVKGKKKFTITAAMVTVKDDYHTYARFLPCLPETKEAFWVQAKLLRPAPEIDSIWQRAQ